MSESVNVCCRFRPLNATEQQKGGASTGIQFADEKRVKVDRSAADAALGGGGGGGSGSGSGSGSDGAASGGGDSSPGGVPSNNSGPLTFSFDHVFPPGSNQSHVFDHSAAAMIQDVFNGYNTTVFAYGQTGSGKTHTMMGNLSMETERGIIPRLVEAIFDGIETSDDSILFTVKVSYVEIYMEKIRDLMRPEHDNLRIREARRDPADSAGASLGVWVEGVTEVYAGSNGDVLDLMEQGQSNRSMAATKMNETSSRSHSVLTITLGQEVKQTGSKRQSKLILVDLAGSEKVAKTGSSGQTLKEAQHINKSLSALGNVINALTTNKPHIPYRDSKLTRLLSDSLGGNSKTLLIITCSPSQYNFDETISTLRFGKRAKLIQNRAKINEEKSAAEYKALLAKSERTIKRLRGCLHRLRSRNRELCQQLGIEPDVDDDGVDEDDHEEVVGGTKRRGKIKSKHGGEDGDDDDGDGDGNGNAPGGTSNDDAGVVTVTDHSETMSSADAAAADDERRKAEAALIASNVEVERLRGELRDLAKDLEDTQSDIVKEKQQARRQERKLSEEHTRAMQEMQKLHEEALLEAASQATTTDTSWQTKIHDIKERNDTLVKQNEGLEEQLSVLQATTDELLVYKNKVLYLEAEHAIRLHGVQEEKTTLESELVDVNKQLDALQGQLQEKDKQLAVEEERAANLKASHQRVISEHGVKLKEMEISNSELQNQVKKLQIEIDDEKKQYKDGKKSWESEMQSLHKELKKTKADSQQVLQKSEEALNKTIKQLQADLASARQLVIEAAAQKSKSMEKDEGETKADADIASPVPDTDAADADGEKKENVDGDDVVENISSAEKQPTESATATTALDDSKSGGGSSSDSDESDEPMELVDDADMIEVIETTDVSPGGGAFAEPTSSGKKKKDKKAKKEKKEEKKEKKKEKREHEMQTRIEDALREQEMQHRREMLIKGKEMVATRRDLMEKNEKLLSEMEVLKGKLEATERKSQGEVLAMQLTNKNLLNEMSIIKREHRTTNELYTSRQEHVNVLEVALAESNQSHREKSQTHRKQMRELQAKLESSQMMIDTLLLAAKAQKSLPQATTPVKKKATSTSTATNRSKSSTVIPLKGGGHVGSSKIATPVQIGGGGSSASKRSKLRDRLNAQREAKKKAEADAAAAAAAAADEDDPPAVGSDDDL